MTYPNATPMLQITGLKKAFPVESGQTVSAVNDVAFEVYQAEIFTLLGPSGCGKSTLLRCIAGLETPEAGEIRIGGNPMYSSGDRLDVPPNHRGIGMVFQSYAVWPHMSVFENVAFPLRAKPTKHRSERDLSDLVMRTLSRMSLDDLADRAASVLSGGQQQRLALARAIVASPSLLILDEPMSNLDAQLKKQMRAELRRLHQELGISFLLVTHDQEDALSLSDRIGVMKQGQICQIGVPRDIYFNPINKFVAEFMGSTNVISGQLVEEAGNNWVFVSDFGPWALQEAPAERRQTEQGLFLRPEDIELSHKPENHPAWSGIVTAVDFMGHRQFATVALPNGDLTAQIGPKDKIDVGDEVFVGLPASPKFLDQSTDALRIQKVIDVD